MILSTLVTSQLHFEMCAGLYGHPVDPRRKRLIMNMQLRQCFAKPIRLKISQKGQIFLTFLFPKKPEFQNLASKKPNWQLCYTRIENAHQVGAYARTLSTFC